MERNDDANYYAESAERLRVQDDPTLLIASYHMRRAHVFRAVVLALVFLGIAVSDTYFMYWRADPAYFAQHRREIVIGMIAFWSFVFVGLHRLAVTLRERVDVSVESIVHQGCFSKTSIPFPNVTQIVWRCCRPVNDSGRFPQDAIRVCSQDANLEVRLDHFTQQEQQVLINFIRSAVPIERQEGWSNFVTTREQTPSTTF